MSEQKKLLRKKVRGLKNSFSEKDKKKKSEKIFEKLEKEDCFKQAEIIMLYWSMPDEVQTHTFIEKWWNEKTIILPVVDGDNLELKVFKGVNLMKQGELFGILEPTGDAFLDVHSIDMIVVPGVAFDKSNRRMGRGRGYYDKLLALTEAVKIGICYSFQLFSEVPVESHDVCMHKVISS